MMPVRHFNRELIIQRAGSKTEYRQIGQSFF